MSLFLVRWLLPCAGGGPRREGLIRQEATAGNEGENKKKAFKDLRDNLCGFFFALPRRFISALGVVGSSGK